MAETGPWTGQHDRPNDDVDDDDGLRTRLGVAEDWMGVLSATVDRLVLVVEGLIVRVDERLSNP